MKKSGKGWIIGIVILVIVIVIGIAAYLLLKKPGSPNKGSGSSSGNGSGTDEEIPCVPYTQAEEKRGKQACQAKCGPQLLIPVAGIGAYYKCQQECVSQLPPLNNCL